MLFISFNRNLLEIISLYLNLMVVPFEFQCPMEIVPSLEKYEWPDPKSRETVLSLFWTQQMNASLALQMTNAWMKRKGKIIF